MTMPLLFRSALLLACLPLATACGKTNSSQDPNIENARRDTEAMQRTLAALPPACTIGTAARLEGKWLIAARNGGAPGDRYNFVQEFDAATSTGAVRAALNRAALRALEKVETRDAQGKWLDAGPVSIHEAPDGCDYVWLQMDLGGQRQVAASRYTFSFSDEPVTLANAALSTSK